MFAFFGGLAAIAALVWGSHTIKVLASYGIGTGVPSAGMIAFGSGVIAFLFATKYGVLAPIVAIILAAVIGAILGYLANEVLAMHIPVMIKSLTEMAVVGALTLMGFSAMITGLRSLEHSICTDHRVNESPWHEPAVRTSHLTSAVHSSQQCSFWEPLRFSTDLTPVSDLAGNRTACLCSQQSAGSFP